MADDGTTRGQFLSLSTVGIGAAIGGVIGVPATAYILAPVTNEAEFQPVFLGKVDQFTSEQGFDPTAATYVEDPQNPSTSPGLRLGSQHREVESRLAGGRRHVHRVLEPVHAPGMPGRSCAGPIGFACPCHGGQYDEQGQRIAGPPIRPLDRFQWEIKNSDELWITQRWSVDFNGDGKVLYFPVKMPGQPVAPPGPSVVADVLYPNVTYDHGAVPQAK